MSEIHPYRTVIPAIADTAPRPLWSVMIPTYNCAHYLRQTLTRVLAQDPGAEVMQIQVVDDCSTLDDPEAVVKEVGQGRVEFYRQPQNVGYIRNFETCLQRSRGELIHLLHGDDYVLDGFYSQLQQGFEQHPELGAAYCRHFYVNEQDQVQGYSYLEQPESGLLSDHLTRIVTRHPIQTPSIVVRRAVYEQLGGFDCRMSSCGEDWEMWSRIAVHYPFWYETQPLAAYRSHIKSLSGKSARTGQNVRDMRLATKIIQAYLPATAAPTLVEQASKMWAFWGLHWAERMLAQRDFMGAIAQVREALRCNHSPPVLLAIGQLLLDTIKHSLQYRLGLLFRKVST